ncbi:DNA starvation/stationary phase protection protein [Roseibacillus persicicus]|uniref:Dps family protein n=1 Tax=Roseibacillus persicicus TaxID=454148 RepID=UPI00398AA004
MNKETVVNALRQVVADSYALLGQTHLCHWNVRGPGFFALHAAFEGQYTELFAAVDELAERVRALGALAPGGLSNLARISGMEEIAEDTPADQMVAHLAKANRKVIASLGEARKAASEAGDDETEDLMIARTQIHEKTVWMLEAYLA